MATAAATPTPSMPVAESAPAPVPQHDVVDEPIDGQRFVLLSFAAVEGETRFAMKIRGVAGTAKAAHELLESIRAYDSSVDIYTATVGGWLICPPSPEEASSTTYEQTNSRAVGEIMANYGKQNEAKAEAERERREAIKSGIVDPAEVAELDWVEAAKVVNAKRRAAEEGGASGSGEASGSGAGSGSGVGVIEITTDT